MVLDSRSGAAKVCARAVVERQPCQRTEAARKWTGEPANLIKEQHPPIDRVTAHCFVGSLTGEHNGDVVPGELRNEVERDARRVRHRLIQMRKHRRYRIPEIACGEQKFMMLGAEMSGRLPRVRELIG